MRSRALLHRRKVLGLGLAAGMMVPANIGELNFKGDGSNTKVEVQGKNKKFMEKKQIIRILYSLF